MYRIGISRGVCKYGCIPIAANETKSKSGSYLIFNQTSQLHDNNKFFLNIT